MPVSRPWGELGESSSQRRGTSLRLGARRDEAETDGVPRTRRAGARRCIASNSSRASAKLPQAARDSMVRFRIKVDTEATELEGEDD
jgi:hypothetical protein